MSFLREYKYQVQIVYILGLFMQIMDATIVNIAIPTLADEFDVDSGGIEWVVIGFILALAIAIPIAGWLGDRYGTKRIFLGSLAGFVVASACCGAAQTLDQLILFRIFQGAFAGVISPVGSAMLFRAFPLAERAKAATAVVGVAVIAPALGPVLGGILIQGLSWRWIFYVNVPLGILALFLGLIWLKEEVVGTKGRIDWAGILLTGSGLALFFLGITLGRSAGWGSGVVLGAMIGSLIILVILVFVETHSDDPLLALRLYANRLFRACNLTGAPAYAGFFSLVFLLPVFLQEIGGYSPLTTGLALLPQPLGVIVSSQIVGRVLYPRVGPRPLLVVGTIGSFVTSFMFVFVDASTSLVLVSTTLFFRGMAMGAVFLSLQTATYATISLPDMGRATSLFNTQRQTSAALGVAVVAAVLTGMSTTVAASSDSDFSQSAFSAAFLIGSLFFILATAAALLIRTDDARATMAPGRASSTRS
jgi:EmrB/QacA subfamily drug resistance transporter